MPIVDYFDEGTQTRKKKEFAYTAVGQENARKFMEKQKASALLSGGAPPKMGRKKSKIKPGTKSPAKSGHTPGVKGTGQTKPGDHHPTEMKKKPEKETKYVQKDPFKFDKKSTVQYGGENY